MNYFMGDFGFQKYVVPCMNSYNRMEKGSIVLFNKDNYLEHLRNAILMHRLIVSCLHGTKHIYAKNFNIASKSVRVSRLAAHTFRGDSGKTNDNNNDSNNNEKVFIGLYTMNRWDSVSLL